MFPETIMFNPNFFFLTLPLLYLVKSSPSKKRRTLPHGPLKKTAASGPFLSTQISSNSQHHLLQHQISYETKEEVEGESGKSWKQDVYFTPECKTVEQTCCWLIPAVFWLVPACSGLLPQHGVNSLSSPPSQWYSRVIPTSSQRLRHPATLLAKHPKSPSLLLWENLDLLPVVSLRLNLRMTAGQWEWLKTTHWVRSTVPPRVKRKKCQGKINPQAWVNKIYKYKCNWLLNVSSHHQVCNKITCCRILYEI